MPFVIWGHRGHQHHRQPEKYPHSACQNSLKALEFPLKNSMGLETDVIQTRNKTPYLAHDTLFIDVVKYELKSHLDSKSQEILNDRFIFELSDDEAFQLYLKDGQKLPMLDDLLNLMPNYPGRTLNLELKGPDTAKAALKAVKTAIAKKLVTEDQVVFSSFNLPELAALRKEVGDAFKIGALFSMKTQTKSKLFPDWPNADQEACYTPFHPTEDVLKLDVLKKIRPDYFHLERNSVNLDDIALIDKYYPKAKVSLWCVGENHPDDKADYIDIIEKLVQTGKIHAVMSDFPEAVQAHCITRGLDVVLLPAAQSQAKSKFEI